MRKWKGNYYAGTETQSVLYDDPKCLYGIRLAVDGHLPTRDARNAG